MPATPNEITTKQIKADVARAKIGLGAVICADWRTANRFRAMSQDEREARKRYLQDANDRAATIERSRIL
jgi:hypothetical protein